jgi:ankyrin repeat protein
MTPLHIACRKGLYSNIVALLHHHDIKINIQDNLNETPLHKILEQNGHEHFRCGKLLINSTEIELSEKNGCFSGQNQRKNTSNPLNSIKIFLVMHKKE